MHVAINDTSPEAERVLVEIYRNMSLQDKWRRLQSLYRTGWDLHEMGYRQRHPDASLQEVVDDWMKLTLDPELYREVRNSIDGSL
ncbi:MAG TPA: hypothetical protein VG826_02610 [Pirellulales bacterium]|nr:hypothetical protein [Pirellulales bacterium]